MPKSPGIINYTGSLAMAGTGKTAMVKGIMADTGGSVIAGADGSYTLVLPFGWSGTVSPSLPGYIFLPASRSYTDMTYDEKTTTPDYRATPGSLPFGTVTKLADTNDGVCDSDCSLREAFDFASPGATINFHPGLYGEIITSPRRWSLRKMSPFASGSRSLAES